MSVVLADWERFFMPAVSVFMRGLTPYGYGFYNPPYTLVLIMPFALLPIMLSRVLIFCTSFGVLAWVAHVRGASVWTLILFLLSPFTLLSLGMGNVEWLTVLGVALANSVGVALMLIKPQMTIGVLGFLALDKVRVRDWRGGVLLFAPAAMLYTVSAWMYPTWLTSVAGYESTSIANAALPAFIGLPIGTAMLALALKTKRNEWALAASPCFFAALSPAVWLVVALAAVRSLKISVAVFVVSWMLILIRLV